MPLARKKMGITLDQISKRMDERADCSTLAPLRKGQINLPYRQTNLLGLKSAPGMPSVNDPTQRKQGASTLPRDKCLEHRIGQRGYVKSGYLVSLKTFAFANSQVFQTRQTIIMHSTESYVKETQKMSAKYTA
jgi:hypothetical protein